MINDTVKSMSPNLIKDLHGHVRVELRDRWTGRVVDSQEKENLVTNMGQNMLAPTAWLDIGGNASKPVLAGAYTPIHEKLLGGLLLFNGALTEAANNIHLPANAKLVAYAGQTSDLVNANAGSYNSLESTYTSNGFTTVWDFATSQANGTIASLARTPYLFPLRPCFDIPGSFSAASSNALNSYYILGYDETNHYLYITPYVSQTIDGTTYLPSSIYRVPADFSKIGLLNSFLLPASKMTLVKTLTSSDGTTSAVAYIYDKYNNNFVYMSGATIHLLAVDGTHTTATAAGVSGGLEAVTGSYYWVRNGLTVYRITKTNPSDVQTITLAKPGILYPMENDIVFVFPDSQSTGNVIVYPDGTQFEINQTSHYLGRPFNRDVGYLLASAHFNAAVTLFPRIHYLGTIANLDSPVTKTSSQTMKITYTLTEA